MKTPLKAHEIKKNAGNLLACVILLYSCVVFYLAYTSISIEKDNIPPPTYLENLVEYESIGTKRISINQADAKMLDTLPGIGPVIAQRIIEYREQNGPFTALEDLLKVRGIGSVKFQDILNFIELSAYLRFS